MKRDWADASDTEREAAFASGAPMDPPEPDGPISGAELADRAERSLAEARAHTSGIRGLSTGFRELDRWLSGLCPKRLYTISAPTGGGKSVFGLALGTQAAFVQRKRVLIFSLEMSAIELAERMIASEGKIDTLAVAAGCRSPEELDRARGVLRLLRESDLHVDERGGLQLEQVTETALRLHQAKPLDLVLVDYAQLVTAPKLHREQEVAHVVRGLRALAKRLSVPLVVMAQVNRDAEHRTDKRPQLSDLRESAALGHESHAVLMLHRPSDFDPQDKRRGYMECYVRKNRAGPKDVVLPLNWHPVWTRLDEGGGLRP